MRILVLLLTILLTACVNKRAELAKKDPTLHCPGFAASSWLPTEIPQTLQAALINKQKFAVPDVYQTLWFSSKNNDIGLCIIPDIDNRGSRIGCGTAYAIFDEDKVGWQMKDQKATICSR